MHWVSVVGVVNEIIVIIITINTYLMPTSVFRTENNRSRRFIFGETGHRSKLCPSVAKKDGAFLGEKD